MSGWAVVDEWCVEPQSASIGMSGVDGRAERREAGRMAVSRAAKVYHHGSRQYLPARTVDYSPTGALLEILHERALTPGETVDVLIAWTSRTLLTAADHVPATVVRTMRGERSLVAVAFEQSQARSRSRAA